MMDIEGNEGWREGGWKKVRARRGVDFEGLCSLANQARTDGQVEKAPRHYLLSVFSGGTQSVR